MPPAGETYVATSGVILPREHTSYVLAWAGALASAVIKQRKLARFFEDHIAAEKISEQQEWAHYSFVGGRIETLNRVI